MVNSREKGKRGEREARDQCIEHWRAPADKCRRAAQVDGGLSCDIVRALPGAHVEVKLYNSIAALQFLQQAIQDSTAQAAQSDRPPSLADFPVVLMRETKPGASQEWTVMLRMKDSKRFAEAVQAQFHNSIPIEQLEGED